jgi:hypothetical protein
MPFIYAIVSVYEESTMSEGLGTYAGTYDRRDGRWVGVRVPSGDLVLVPERTGFSFIDSQLEPTSRSQGDTLVAEGRPHCQ